jgi:hypothetical protein
MLRQSFEQIMDIPALGELIQGIEYNAYYHYSAPLPIAVLHGEQCSIQLDHYELDPNKEDFHRAIANFLALTPAALQEAEPHIFRYYQDCNDGLEILDPDDAITIESPSDLWKHIQIGDQVTVSRRDYGDKGIYISIACSCDWEHEHGLQLVFKNGLTINKVGPYDGHLTNSDAYADDALEEVIYC